VVVVVLLVEPVGPDMLPAEPLPDEEPVVPPLEPLPVVEPLPLAPGPPIELVLPVVPPLLPVVVSLLLLLPVVPAVLPLDGDGVVAALPDDGLVVVLLDELDDGGVLASRFVQAPSDRAAATVRTAAAHCVRDIFIRKLLESVFGKWRGQP
jgi:hypothetical protein